MVVTGMLNTTQKENEDTDSIAPHACLEQVERLVRSPCLSNSDALCKLLQFLANHTLRSPSNHLKEYEIATQVFGRPPDFDPQTDSSVRVQMGRLRTKLSEYYQTVGIGDPIVVDVPKGSYSLSFRHKIVTVINPPEKKVAVAPSAQAVPTRVRLSFIIGIAAIIGVVATAWVLIAISHRFRASSDQANGQGALIASPILKTFWGPFIQNAPAPFVIFSNAQFVGNPVTGMRYYDPSRDSRDQVSEKYTGIGEVMGVAELEGLFLGMGRHIQIKRGGLFTLDDARENNLIFVGSRTENLTLGEIPYNDEFVFKRLQVGPNDWVQGVVDLHPLAGESGVYLPTPESQPMQVDYAVISLTHGLDHSHWILILAGASTVGTHAAVDYVCDADSVKDLLNRLRIRPGSDMEPFAALLRVKVANDVPLTTELVRFRKTQ